MDTLTRPRGGWAVMTGSHWPGELEKLFKSTPWLNRCIKLRANAVGSLPFVIKDRAGAIVDDSKHWRNRVSFLGNPRRLLYAVEVSLTLTKASYLWPVRDRSGRLRDLRPLATHTIKPVADAWAGLTGFERTTSQGVEHWRPDELVYIWGDCPFTEVGPGTTSPAAVALRSAGVLFQLGEFERRFFEAGAIKATVLQVSGNPPEAEMNRIREWWRQFVAGVRNAFTARAVNADMIKPVVLGEGVESLQNVNLTAEKKEDIAAALGVPGGMLDSGGIPSGLAHAHDRRFYQDTIIPEAAVIGESLNEQLFRPAGYRLEFQPQRLPCFQKGEAARAEAFITYAGSGGMPPSVAAEMLGLTLPEGVRYGDLDAAEERRFQRTAGLFQTD